MTGALRWVDDQLDRVAIYLVIEDLEVSFIFPKTKESQSVQDQATTIGFRTGRRT